MQRYDDFAIPPNLLWRKCEKKPDFLMYVNFVCAHTSVMKQIFDLHQPFYFLSKRKASSLMNTAMVLRRR